MWSRDERLQPQNLEAAPAKQADHAEVEAQVKKKLESLAAGKVEARYNYL